MPMDPHQPPKVLIVDDHPGNLDALEVMLAPSDCVPVRASYRRTKSGRRSEVNSSRGMPSAAIG